MNEIHHSTCHNKKLINKQSEANMKNKIIAYLGLITIIYSSTIQSAEVDTENSQQYVQGINNYSINKYTLSSGGGVIAGGDYHLTSSIGQIDAGKKATGGNYEFRGGFLTGSSDLIFRNGFE